MQLVDAHCHLESNEYNDLDTVIRNAEQVGVVKLITCSITPGQWTLSQRIAEAYPSVEFALGIHPWHIPASDLSQLDGLRQAKDRGACAIGEIGLDKVIDNLPLELQKHVFKQQLIIAKETDLPVIMHCRKAFNEMLEILKVVGAPAKGGIIHSFNGSKELAAEFLKYNINFSIGGILTYRNSKKRAELLKYIYPDHFLLETDSPDILPVHLKERPNLPENIIFNLKAAAEILGLTEEDVARHTTENAVRIFGLEI